MHELAPNEVRSLVGRMPSYELSYETVTHKKVSDERYDLCLAIPAGRKALLWFTFFEDRDVCVLFELNRDRKIAHAYIVDHETYDAGAIYHGTLFYATLVDGAGSGSVRFMLEDVFYYQGVPVANEIFSERLAVFADFFQYCDGRFVLPHMQLYQGTDGLGSCPYEYHHIQYRSLVKIAPYLNYHESKSRGSVDVLDTLVQSTHRKPIRPDFAKPQYRMPTVFLVRPDLQNDIYHLFAYGPGHGHDQAHIYCGLAYVPNYKTSVWLNGIFRRIKENRNLDAIEESDDEEDFQDSRIDKYVDLAKTAIMECTFHPKFRQWVPTKMMHKGTRIVHVSRLART
jgi:hypothetical protein